MKTELKDCPFCGSNAVLHESSKGFRVVCQNTHRPPCDIGNTHGDWTRDAAIEMWNRRPIDYQPGIMPASLPAPQPGGGGEVRVGDRIKFLKTLADGEVVFCKAGEFGTITARFKEGDFMASWDAFKKAAFEINRDEFELITPTPPIALPVRAEGIQILGKGYWPWNEQTQQWDYSMCGEVATETDRTLVDGWEWKEVAIVPLDALNSPRSETEGRDKERLREAIRRLLRHQLMDNTESTGEESKKFALAALAHEQEAGE